MFYTYILQSKSTGKLYIGQTNNLDDRLYRHNSGQSKSTKSGMPWHFIYSKPFPTRTEAVRLERQLKSWKNPTKVIAWISRQCG